MLKAHDKKLNRVIDANFNRAKEGLRVCEDVCRFVLDARGLTRSYKTARHRLTQIINGFMGPEMVRARGIEKDVGRKSAAGEFNRRSIKDIFFANSQRAKESVRVLEEFAKLRHKGCAERLKQLRYQLYALEKKAIERR